MKIEDIEIGQSYNKWRGSTCGTVTLQVTAKGQQLLLGFLSDDLLHEVAVPADALSPIPPKRWEFVDYRLPKNDEFYVAEPNGEVQRASHNWLDYGASEYRTIVKEIVE